MQIAENSCQLPLPNQWAKALSLLRTELGASVRCRGDVNGMSAASCHVQELLDTPCFQPRNRLCKDRNQSDRESLLECTSHEHPSVASGSEVAGDFHVIIIMVILMIMIILHHGADDHNHMGMQGALQLGLHDGGY